MGNIGPLGTVICLVLVCCQARLGLEYFFASEDVSRLEREIRSVNSGIQPTIDNSTPKMVNVTSGKTAYLNCKVKNLGDRMVSWIRKKDLHVITVGKYTYSNDPRFQVLHMEGSEDWMLQIKFAQKRDGGIYECQVSSVPKISIFITLYVIVSEAMISGSPALYLKRGSLLNLTCVIRETPIPPEYVHWYHNTLQLNYDSPRGVSVHTEKSSTTISRLYIANSVESDTGNYSCVPSNASPATISVHVLNGEHPAAMHHGHKHSTATKSTYELNFLFLICFLVLFWDIR